MSTTGTQSRAGIIRAMFAASDRGDVEGLVSFLTDDAVLVLGNGDPVEGKEAISAMSRQFTSTIGIARHEIHEIWQAAEDADVQIAHITIHFSKLDGNVVSLPSVSVFRMSGDLIADYRMYMDASPVTG
jgi:uncharacterized protein (TIGR02246 family)